MEINKVGYCYTVSNANFWVKSIHPHITFTTSEEEALHCFTEAEAIAIQEYIGEQFAF